MKNDILPKKYDNIKVVRDFSTNDFMFVSDMLITDYSSVIFEYALLKKLMIFSSVMIWPYMIEDFI